MKNTANRVRIQTRVLSQEKQAAFSSNNGRFTPSPSGCCQTKFETLMDKATPTDMKGFYGWHEIVFEKEKIMQRLTQPVTVVSVFSLVEECSVRRL
jgi:hypothetical protein